MPSMKPLSTHHWVRLGLAVVLAAMVTWGSDRMAHGHAHKMAQGIVTEFLAVGLTPYVLGDDSTPPDELSLYLWMHQIQPHLADRTFHHWASPGRLELLWIVRIGDTTIGRPAEWVDRGDPPVHTVRWRIGDHWYEAGWTGAYARNTVALAGIGSVTLVALLLVSVAVPIPLKPEQRTWHARLLSNGVDAKTALSVARNPRIPDEGVSAEADMRFEQLRACGVPPTLAMDWVFNDAVEDLSDLGWAWFLIGLNVFEADFGRSLELARHPDTLEIRYEPPGVWVRGIELPMPGGLRSYYALYAQRRAHGEGWVENVGAPKSASGANDLRGEFLALADRLETHEKSRSTVERKGITAADLTGNRNRIKGDILKLLAIPDEVPGAAELTALAATPYLFEKQMLAGKERNAFRIVLDSASIRLG